MTEIASLVLFSAALDETARFYRALGIELEDEQHEGGPRHFACELGPVHFAIYAAEIDGQAPGRRTSGSDFLGFYVQSLEATATALAPTGAPVLSDHEHMPWGCRLVVQDPDGRAIEINQHAHCPAK